MTYGSEQYFAERSRFEARLSALTAGIAALMLALLLAITHSPVRRVINDPERFGFEGPENYVRRIELETYGNARGESNVQHGLQYVPRVRRGGGTGRERVPLRQSAPLFSHGPLGPGEAPNDLLARAMRRTSSVPLVRSEELVFVRLVRPPYPDEAKRRGIEGRFSVLALIDTSGRVVEVEVQSVDPQGLLEREAAAAVMQCVIRPYRVDGVPREIVARFPFNFYFRD
jgi:TonB family protein